MSGKKKRVNKNGIFSKREQLNSILQEETGREDRLSTVWQKFPNN